MLGNGEVGSKIKEMALAQLNVVRESLINKFEDEDDGDFTQEENSKTVDKAIVDTKFSEI